MFPGTISGEDREKDAFQSHWVNFPCQFLFFKTNFLSTLCPGQALPGIMAWRRLRHGRLLIPEESPGIPGALNAHLCEKYSGRRAELWPFLNIKSGSAGSRARMQPSH